MVITLFQKHLKDKINTLETSMKTQNEEHTKATDDLYKTLQEVKGQLHASGEQCTKLQSTVEDQSEKQIAANKKIQELEAALSSKVKGVL